MHVSVQRRPSALPPILHSTKVHNIAHDDSSREIHQEPGDQAGAPRAGVGLQPPASVADTDGADGADAALYRRDCDGLSPSLARDGAGHGSFRSRRGGAALGLIAGFRSMPGPMKDNAQPS